MTAAGYLHGKPCCSCILAWWPVFESLVGRSVPITQAIGDAPASAGFHKGGGSIDCGVLTEDELRKARNCGAAAWNRWWTNNFHAHIRLNGCSHNSIGQPQVTDLNEGRDGTGPLWDNAGEADNGPRTGVKWPLRTWREGIDWAKQQEEDRDMATLAEQILAGVNALTDAEKARADRGLAFQKLVRSFIRKSGTADTEILADLDRLIAQAEQD